MEGGPEEAEAAEAAAEPRDEQMEDELAGAVWDAEEDEGYELDVSAEMAAADDYLARLDRLAAGGG